LYVKPDCLSLSVKAFLADTHIFEKKPQFTFLNLVLPRRLKCSSNTVRRQSESKAHTTMFVYIISENLMCLYLISGYFRKKDVKIKKNHRGYCLKLIMGKERQLIKFLLFY
jgi:hypothetical protein